jgi:glycosyltransferase involved in cell wall biosynthesis
LLHWKGFELGMRAFAQFHSQLPDSQYWLIGNGPEKARLQKIARQLGVEDAVVFWGELPRPQVLEKLAECDVLVHPSLHDSGGWVCAEAMAAGLPVICLDLGGPALQVAETSGVKLRPESADQVVRELAGALKPLLSDPALAFSLGMAGRDRVREHFNWEGKGILISNFYREICESSITRRPLIKPERTTTYTC